MDKDIGQRHWTKTLDKDMIDNNAERVYLEGMSAGYNTFAGIGINK